MTSENISSDKEVLLKGMLAVGEGRDLLPFLIVGGHDAENILLSSVGFNWSEHFRQIGGEVYKIVDYHFVMVLGDSISPVVGNCYAYVNEATLRGIIRQEKDQPGYSLLEISMANIVDHRGDVIKLDL